ncbi:MAG: tetratricopeptide (TPR) repeat protein [Polaribacter sp.]|jgi:tetratricopeptide (TPR) repeat protein
MKLTKYYLLIGIIISSLLSALINANPAIQAFEDENYELAKELFEKDKGSAISKLYLGRLEMKNGNLDEAEELIKSALNMKPNDSVYHYWFASISGVQAGNASIFSAPGYASDSKKHYMKAVELDPTNIEALSGLISFYTQAPSIVGGSIEKAQKLAIKLTELDRKEGLVTQISIHRKENETAKELQKAEELVLSFPNSSEALLKAGFSYQGAKSYEHAFEHFTNASKFKDKLLGGDLNKKDKKNEALASMDALYQIGRNAVLSGIKVEEGVLALESYLKLVPNKNQPSLNWATVRLADLYFKMGNKEKAVMLAIAAKKDKSDGGPRKIAKKLLKKIKNS